MKQQFYKYQGTGNDFVMVDNRMHSFDKNNTNYIKRLCDRRFGIGADGLILLEKHPDLDFKMVYFNADGHQSSMCGNGGRCLVAFAQYLNIIKDKASFEAVDGIHHALIEDGLVHLQMQDVTAVDVGKDHIFLDTGSPHHVELVQDLDSFDVRKRGREVRYGQSYAPAGTNVNFVSPSDNGHFRLRTYERGVEDETLSCGTGATAVAIGMYATGKTELTTVALDVMGGKLQVSFDPVDHGYKNVWLIGPAVLVFKAELP